MFAAGQAANELKTVLDNHKKIEEYKAAPYDKRKDLYPEGEPKRIELCETALQNLHQLMLKLSYEAKSTLFDEEDEEDGRESAEDDGDAIPTNEKFCVQLIKVGPTKVQVVKTIKEFSCMSLTEAKNLVDVAEERDNVIVAKDLAFFEAIELKGRLLESGAQRPTQENQNGGFKEMEAKIDASNVMLICPTCGKPTRVGHAKNDEGKKVRVCKKCGAQF
jgi:ribosomal protein L24